MNTPSQNDALQRELDDLRQDKEEKERELQDENAELQGNVAKMRAELEAIMKELQDLMDTKLGLELEIAAYRKLLEGEENRCDIITLSFIRRKTRTCVTTVPPRRHRSAGTRVRGTLCRWEKAILALGPKMSPGRGLIWCFLHGENLKLRHCIVVL